MNIRDRKVVIHIDNQTQQSQNNSQFNIPTNQPETSSQQNVSSVPASPPKKNSLPKGAIVIALIIIIIAGAVAFAARNNNSPSQNVAVIPTPTRVGETSNSPDTETEQVLTYQDGKYDAVGEYISPGGREKLAVSVTLEDGKITDIEVTPQASLPISSQMQADFAANYKPMVQGRNIDEVHLTKVSGSSLTPGGFNDALEKIKAQARS